MNLKDIADNYSDNDKARAFLEATRWPNGPICPHCGVENEAYRLEAHKPGSKTRKGLWKCKPCRKQFTVTVGTIFEDSHIPLSKWLMAFHLIAASKKGMSAHQLHRMMGITYRAAWFMAHRIRYAMKQEPLSDMLTGTVEVDETYVGGRRKGTPPGRVGVDSHKAPVVALVERGGRVRSIHMERVTAVNLRQAMRENISPEAHVMTDDLNMYHGAKKEFASHHIIKHKLRIYSKRAPDGHLVTTNTVEGFFSLLKRGVNGTFHHVSKKHLHRYLSEFDFRYNARKIKDGERMMLALKSVDGKRLMYRDSSASA
jgi:transposase-like protein